MRVDNVQQAPLLYLCDFIEGDPENSDPLLGTRDALDGFLIRFLAYIAKNSERGLKSRSEILVEG